MLNTKPFLAALAVLLFLSSPPAARAQGGVRAERTVAILGSSIAAGVGASSYDSAWAGRYARHLAGLKPAWTLVNLAVSGYTTYHVLPTGTRNPANRPAVDTAHNITKVLALRPECLIISLTGNDISNSFAAAEYQANFDTLHALATRAGIKTWITTPLPRNTIDSAKRKMVLDLRARILSRYAPRAIDYFDSLGMPDGRFVQAFNSGDGIHPNNRGHALLFRRALAAKVTGSATALFGAVPVRSGDRPVSLGRVGGSWLFADPAGGPLDMLGRRERPALR